MHTRMLLGQTIICMIVISKPLYQVIIHCVESLKNIFSLLMQVYLNKENNSYCYPYLCLFARLATIMYTELPAACHVNTLQPQTCYSSRCQGHQSVTMEMKSEWKMLR